MRWKMDTVFRPSYGQLILVLLSLLALCYRTDAQCASFSVFDGLLELDTATVCQKIYSTSECKKFAVSFNQSDLPENFPRNEQSVEPPLDLNILGTSFAYSNSYMYPGVMVKWKSPKSEAARRNQTGYLLVFRNDTVMRCRLFQLDQMNDLLTKELTYQYSIFSIEASTDFTMEVYSLPCCINERVREESSVSMLIRTPPPQQITQFGVAPATWSSLIAYKTFNNGTIIVKFTLPPPSMNLTTFALFLMKQSDLNNPLFEDLDYTPQYSEENPQGLVIYTVNSSDCYQVKINGRDENGTRDVDGKCSCWSVRNDRKTCENTCSGFVVKFCMNVTDVAPAYWKSHIEYKTFNNGTIIVKFTLPPPSMNLTTFALFLINQSDSNNPLFHDADYRPQQYSEENPQGVVTYFVTKSGCFQFKITPRDENGTRDVDGKCSCWSYRNGRKTCENTCASSDTKFCLNVTGSNSFATTDGPAFTVSSTGDANTMDPLMSTLETVAGADSSQVSEIIAGGIVGGILFVVLAVLFVFILWKSSTGTFSEVKGFDEDD